MPESAPPIQIPGDCRFDYDRCTGCGTCFEQRPVHSIEMFGEPS